LILRSPGQSDLKDGCLLVGFIVLALVLCWPILNMGIWGDELCSLNDVSLPDVTTVIAKMYGRMDDLHPPLSYVLLFFATKSLGTGEFAMRTPPLLCGLILIALMYCLGKTVHSRQAGLLAAFFAAVSPFADYFACQSRGYALATLLTAVCLIFFCKLSANDGKSKKLSFVIVAATTAMLCYTEYVSCFMLPALGLATLWITLSLYRGNEAEKAQAWPTLQRCLAALTIGFLLFVPWIGSALIQSGNMHDLVTAVPRWHWPKIFAYNLLMMSPIPLIVGQPLGQFAAAALVVWALKNARVFSGQWLAARLLTLPSSYVVMLSALLLPSSLIGYITPWCYGYFRYIYPYSPAGWTLLAILLLHLFSPALVPAQATEKTFQAALRNTLMYGCAIVGILLNIMWPDLPLGWIFLALLLALIFNKKAATGDPGQEGRKLRKVALGITLISGLALNILYMAWFISKPQSGLRTCAREALSGKYDDAVILVAPDGVALTLGYYLSEAQRKAHHLEVHGFPRWDNPFIPVAISDLAKQWGPPEVVADAEKRIDGLAAKGFKYLALAKDSDKQIEFLTTATVPRSARIKALVGYVESKYPKVSQTYYPGLTEDVTVTIYKLSNN
jgi:hypothetical protein